MTLHLVMEKQSLWSGAMQALKIADRKIIVINIDGKFFAYDDKCAHQRFPLSEGTLCGHVLTCGAHHWEYDACTGLGINPQKACLRAYPVVIKDSKVFVEIT